MDHHTIQCYSWLLKSILQGIGAVNGKFLKKVSLRPSINDLTFSIFMYCKCIFCVSPEGLVRGAPGHGLVVSEDGDGDEEHAEADTDEQQHVEAVHRQPGHQQPAAARHTPDYLK